MAPDINALSNDPSDASTNHQDGTNGSANGPNGASYPHRNAAYSISDITYYSPQNRKIKVLTIGAGVSGILMAYQIQKHCENVEHVIYEQNEDIGGTWLLNRYPGCACGRTYYRVAAAFTEEITDIPSHAYTYNFALNPDWPRFFSYSHDIWKYLDKVCNTWGLRKYMTFNTEVVGCWWREQQGQWKVKLRQTHPGGQSREFEDTCDLLLHATGILNNFKWPDIEGIEKFKGRMVHTARWPKDYQADRWKNDRVAVIGSGASSIQTVPNMQPYAKHLDVFVRTGVWFVQIASNFGQNKQYSQEERDTFRRDKKALVAHAKDIEDQVNGLWDMFFSDSEAQRGGQELFRNRMAEFIKDKRLLEGFTPKWGIGCRRITPGDPYMQAIQKENVDFHFTAVDKITEDGVVGADGIERKVDTVVCATGFDVSYRPRFPIVGINGKDLAEKWKVCPESYLGLAIPEFPNFLTFIGPTWPIENGSVMGPLGTVADYALQIIKKMQGENIRSLAPKQAITDLFNAHCQEFITHTVWKEECRSWYKNNETGRVNAIWPGSSLHYQEVIARPRFEDYEITYKDVNPWAHLGLGFTVANRTKGADISPYLSVDNVDPEWLKAVGHEEAGGS